MGEVVRARSGEDNIRSPAFTLRSEDYEGRTATAHSVLKLPLAAVLRTDSGWPEGKERDEPDRGSDDPGKRRQ